MFLSHMTVTFFLFSSRAQRFEAPPSSNLLIEAKSDVWRLPVVANHWNKRERWSPPVEWSCRGKPQQFLSFSSGPSKRFLPVKKSTARRNIDQRRGKLTGQCVSLFFHLYIELRWRACDLCHWLLWTAIIWYLSARFRRRIVVQSDA